MIWINQLRLVSAPRRSTSSLDSCSNGVVCGRCVTWLL
jgi:hypothetical protein